MKGTCAAAKGCKRSGDSKAMDGVRVYNLSGNVWEWTSDAFRGRSLSRQAKIRNAQAAQNADKVLKDGSFLCDKSYCYRYRIPARLGSSPDSSPPSPRRPRSVLREQGRLGGFPGAVRCSRPRLAACLACHSGELCIHAGRRRQACLDDRPQLAAIRFFHRGAGVDNPTEDAGLSAVLKGIRRTVGVVPRQKAPARRARASQSPSSTARRWRRLTGSRNGLTRPA